MLATLVMFALPAEVLSLKVMLPGCIGFVIVRVALPPVLELLNTSVASTSWMLALAAVLLVLKVMLAKEASAVEIVALPAVLELLNCSALWLASGKIGANKAMVALLAVLVLLNVSAPVAALVMLALPAEVASKKSIVALLVIWALPALLVSLNCSTLLLTIVAVPGVLAFSKLVRPVSLYATGLVPAL